MKIKLCQRTSGMGGAKWGPFLAPLYTDGSYTLHGHSQAIEANHLLVSLKGG